MRGLKIPKTAGTKNSHQKESDGYCKLLNVSCTAKTGQNFLYKVVFCSNKGHLNYSTKVAIKK